MNILYTNRHVFITHAKFLLLFLIILFQQENIFANKPNIKFKKFGENENFFGHIVNTTFQDSTGLIWLGSTNGLYRYNGYDFQFFSPRFINNEISNAEIKDITSLNSRYLFIVAHTNLYLFNKEKEKFIKLSVNCPEIKTSVLYHFVYTDWNGNIWIGSNNGFFKVTSDIGKIIKDEEINLKWHYIIKSDTNTQDYYQIYFIEQISENELVIGTNQNIYFFNQNNNFSVIDIPTPVKHNTRFSIMCALIDSNNNIWIGTENIGVIRYNFKTKESVHYHHQQGHPFSLSGNTVWAIHEDIYHNIWIGTERNGLNYYNPRKELFYSYIPSESDPNSISNKTIFSLFSDRSGCLWIGTWDGFNICNIPMKKFNTLHTDQSKRKSGDIKTITEGPNGCLWISSDEGFFRYNNKKDSMKAFYYNEKASIQLSHFVVFSLVFDKSGKLWIGTLNGLDCYNPLTGEYKQFEIDRFDPYKLANEYISNLFIDREERLWVGTLAGLHLFDRQTGNFKRYLPASNSKYKSDSIMGWNILDIIEDKKGLLWIATDMGINTLDVEQDKFSYYGTDKVNSRSFAPISINVLFEDKDSTIWIGANSGLYYFDKKHKKIKHQDINIGVSPFKVSVILEDNNDNLWLGTNVGIVKYSPKSGSVFKYNSKDGVIHNKINEQSGYKDKKGWMYFGTPKGITYFHPDSIKNSSFIPSVVFTGLKISNKSIGIGDTIEGEVILHKSIIHTNKINFNYRHTNFTIEFAALNYLLQQKNQFKYKMEGIHNYWISGTYKQNYASFSNLNPGDYTLLVKGSNNDGIWNPDPARLDISISPPPWGTWWAYSIYSMIFISLLLVLKNFLLFREKLKSQLLIERIEAKKMSELNQMKLRFFTNISHELRTPLTLIVSPLDMILKKITFDRDTHFKLNLIYKNSQRMHRLVNQLLDFSKLDSGFMELNIQQNDIVLFVKEVFESFLLKAKESDMNYHFMSNFDSYPAYFDKDKLEKILFNLLSNSFKYTKSKGDISLHLTINKPVDNQKNDYYYATIQVEDNGIGIKAENLEKIFDMFYQAGEKIRNSSGIGLALTSRLVTLHKGKIKAESEKGKMTRFTVILPVSKAAYVNSEIDNNKSNQPEIPFTHNTGNLIVSDTKLQNKINTKSKSRLLIVEDNEELRNYLVDEFQKTFPIISANNGIEGLEKTNKYQPDIIISDIMMPQMDGLEMCEKIKTNPGTSHIPIILLTAKAGEENEVTGYTTGADDYIIKPFDINILKLKVSNILNSRLKLREKFLKKSNIKVSDIEINTLDDKILKKAINIVEKNISNVNFSVEDLCREMSMSRTLLFNKLKALTDTSITEFIRTIRLKRAAELLSKGQMNVSEVSDLVGFNSRSYFTRSFSKYFGCSPVDYRIISKLDNQQDNQ